MELYNIMKEFVQRGENPVYPKKVVCWRKSSNTVPPEWLTDKSKVIGITDGTYELATRKYDDGTYEYITPDLHTIVKVSSDDDYICMGDISKYEKGKIFSLRPRQFELLYRESK